MFLIINKIGADMMLVSLVISRMNCFQKTGGCPIWKGPKYGHKKNHKIIRFYVFKANEVIGEIKLTPGNKSSFVQVQLNFHGTSYIIHCFWQKTINLIGSCIWKTFNKHCVTDIPTKEFFSKFLSCYFFYTFI